LKRTLASITGWTRSLDVHTLVPPFIEFTSLEDDVGQVEPLREANATASPTSHGAVHDDGTRRIQLQLFLLPDVPSSDGILSPLQCIQPLYWIYPTNITSCSVLTVPAGSHHNRSRGRFVPLLQCSSDGSAYTPLLPSPVATGALTGFPHHRCKPLFQDVKLGQVLFWGAYFSMHRHCTKHSPRTPQDVLNLHGVQVEETVAEITHLDDP
jgi:hypothetical protein